MEELNPGSNRPDRALFGGNSSAIHVNFLVLARERMGMSIYFRLKISVIALHVRTIYDNNHETLLMSPFGHRPGGDTPIRKG